MEKKIVFIILLLAGNTSFAQDVPEIGELFGRVVGLENVIESGSDKNFAEEQINTFKLTSVTPAYIRPEDTDIFGLSLSASILSNGTLGFRALNIAPDEADGFNQFRIDYKHKLPTELFNSKLMLRFTDNEDINSTNEVRFLADKELELGNRGVLITGNLIWRDRSVDNGPSVSDLGASVGTSTKLTQRLRASIDHSFEDDIGDAVTSVSGSYGFGATGNNPTVTFGGDSDDTLFLALSFGL